MSFQPKTSDWKRLPTEARQEFLRQLQQRAAVSTTEKLSAVELAKACGIDPDEWQRDLFESEDRQIILNCARQTGKSTISALLGLHETAYKSDSLSLVLSPSQRQSSETYRKVREFYNTLAGVPDVIAESSLKLELANGSRIQVLPGKEATIRGFSDVSLLIVDEASRVPDELYNAVRPMLAVSGGRIILLSTPFGSRGFFWSEWVEGGPDWKRVRVTASECPRIPADWLEKERSRIGDWWYSQEYQCIFVDNLEACFSTADIQAAITSEVEPLWAM